MIAHRFLTVTCALLAFALVPTFIHSYSGGVIRDGRSAADVPASLAGFSSTPSRRNATWGMRRFESDDWVERLYRRGSQEVRLTVVRTYDPKSIYHHPELAVAYGTGFRPVTVERLDARADLPLHVLRPAVGSSTLGAYVLQYADRFVSDPILFQIRTAGELLVSPRQAMTLFFTTETVSDADAPLASAASPLVLLAAIDAFLKPTAK